MHYNENEFNYEANELIASAKNISTLMGLDCTHPQHLLFAIIENNISLAATLLFDASTKTPSEIMLYATKFAREERNCNEDGYAPIKHIIENAKKNSLDIEFYEEQYGDKATAVGIMLSMMKDVNCAPFFKEIGVTIGKYKNLLESYLSKMEDFPEAEGLDEITGYLNEGFIVNTTSPTLGGKNVTPKSKSGTLSSYCENLNLYAQQHKVECYGRKSEIETITATLNNKLKRNVLLVGEPGVGKTVIVEYMAHLINEGKLPTLSGMTIYSLNINEFVSGTMYRGMFEERMKFLIDELKKNKKAILFIDEVHTASRAGNGDGDINLFNVLKPAMARGDVQVILCTTLDEYRILEKDKAFLRRCNRIVISEPDETQTLKILKSIVGNYERHHNVIYSPIALSACVDMANRFIGNKHQPDKSIEIMDSVGSFVKIAPTNSTGGMEKKLKVIHSKKIAIRDNQDYSAVPALLAEEKIVLSKIKRQSTKSKMVTEKEVYAYMKKNYNVNFKTHHSYPDIENNITSKLVGQNKAVKEFIDAYEISQYGLDTKNTKGNFMMIGTTGVGKTEMVKLVAKELFNNRLMIIDCSEYQDKYAVDKLIGANPGLVGYDEGGQMVEFNKNNPEAVYLFDEIEKGHYSLHDLLLHIMGDGRLSDNKGYSANFKNSMICMTSNIGVKTFSEISEVGFVTRTKDDDAKKAHIEKELEKHFRPEFINRLDEIIYLKDLNKTDIEKIYDIYFEELKKKAKDKLNKDILDDVNLKNRIVAMSLSQKQGARPLKRNFNKFAIKQLVENAGAVS